MNEADMKRLLSNRAFGVFAVGLVFLIVIAVLMLQGMRDVVQTGRLVTHTEEVIAKINELLATADDIETGSRGYLLTADERFLEPYDGTHRHQCAIRGTANAHF